MIPTAHPSPQSKRHLDRFSRFAELTSVADRQREKERERERERDRPTDHATRSVLGNNWPHLRTYSTAMRPNNWFTAN